MLHVTMEYRALLLLSLLNGAPLSWCLPTQVPVSTHRPISTSADPTTEAKISSVGSTLISIAPGTTTLSTSIPNATAEITETRPLYTSEQNPVTPLQESVEWLSCNLAPLPAEYTIWKGNETLEFFLPIKVPGDCSGIPKRLCQENSTVENVTEPSIRDCPDYFSWDGSIDIQSGDVLLVRIDDAQLIHQNPAINSSDEAALNDESMMLQPTTAVYQVTRSGLDNCDVTEGILLDITPLRVDDKKVVTLYDKDLTLGINLLIVVAPELWGSQCIRLKVTVKSDNCGENEDCSARGICYSNVSMDGYECQCCLGSVGQHCEEEDACYPSPCKNNGICVDISQGHEGSTFQCLCPYGYVGDTCEEQTNPCTSMPCQNGATCTGNVTQFKCECLQGYTGVLCQHSHNECESSPCANGICIDEEDGYKCFCTPGYSGLNCDIEYNECSSSPCINGGTCTDHLDSFLCTCGRGYTGNFCQIKVDLCEPNPCALNRNCMDRGNNITCVCEEGFVGPNCDILASSFKKQEGPTCEERACSNGGTCWGRYNCYFCSCQAGFTGPFCEDELVMETIIDEKGRELDLQLPVSIHLEYLHNAYVAAGTLACALAIVVFILIVCHCRVNKTYKRFIVRADPLWGCKSRRVNEALTATNSEWFSGKNKALTATPSRCLPSLDVADMYYTLDFSDSQSSPLIQ